MRRLFLILLACFLLPFAVVQAQSVDCLQAVKDASATLDQARVALEAGNSATAIALINAAQTLMSLCELSVPAEAAAPESTAVPATALPATPAVENTAVPAPTETPAVSDITSTTTAYTVNAPQIDPTKGIAFVRFAHTSADTGPIDIFLESMGNTPLIAGLDFGEATDFILMNSDQETFIIRSELGAELLRDRRGFTANSSWIMLAIGLQSNFSFLVEPISVTRNEYNESARVRVVNMIPGIRLGVTASDGTRFARGLSYIGTQDTSATPGTYQLQILTADGNPYSDPVTLDFAANTTYTLFIIGGGTSGITAKLMVLTSIQDTTRIRFVNQRAESVALYYRPGNNLLLDNFAPGTTTDYFTLPSRSTAFIAYLAGTGPGSREQAALSVQMRPGRDVTVALNAAGRMEIIEETLTILATP